VITKKNNRAVDGSSMKHMQ